MRTTVLSIICVLAVTGAATAYDLPEVIGDLTDITHYATDFCWVGDQNGDGCDDLLINNSGNNRVDLHYGGERIDDEPAFSFEPYLEQQDVCLRMNFIGNIIPDRSAFIALKPFIRSNSPDSSISMLNLYEGETEINNEPEFSMSRMYQNLHGDCIMISEGFRTRPADYNGDGISDLLGIERGDNGKLLIFYGGEEFDTIPDWQLTLNSPWNIIGSTKYSSGYDVNSDGYDDILLKTNEPDEEGHYNYYWYSLYLGGSPMDTVPLFSFRQDHFEGRFEQRQMIHGFSMLPDVNGDGYDDWGIYWYETHERYEEDGFLIFFGGEEPDMEPDLELEGHRRLWHDNGGLTGGDFNGDGIGDIAARLTAGNPSMCEIHIHFGSRWMDGEADIYIDLEHDYGGQYFNLISEIGSTGDYNGDDVDDFVAGGCSRVFVFAGNRDWEVSVDNKPVPEVFILSLNTNPNPFNSSVTITYETVQSSSVRLAVYDVRGRLVEEPENRRIIKGHHRLTWTHNISGIYFVLLEIGNARVVKKIVCVP